MTGTPFRIEKIRARRAKPGLLRQHLTAVLAIAEISDSEITGAELGASELSVRPGRVRGGSHRFEIGSAGSTVLVLQTILPPLLFAPEPSQLLLEGGTHNTSAPTWDYLARVFLPLLERMGARVTTELDRYGFYPAGGGAFRVVIEPVAKLAPLSLLERGPLRACRARALVANLPRGIGERELATLRARIPGLEDAAVVEVRGSRGPGNALLIEVESEHVREMFTSFGERGVPARTVADRLAREALAYLGSDAPVGPHLADQLIVPLALAGDGEFRTLPLTTHFATNVSIVERFLPVRVRWAEEASGSVRVELR